MNSRLSPRAGLALAILAVFTVWITWRAKALEIGLLGQDSASVLLHKPAPAFTLDSLDGRRISLADDRGKPLVVVFWASWCQPCRMELPVLARFYRRAHNSGADFEILAISIDSDMEDARSAAKSLNLPFPVLFGGASGIATSYHVDAIPAAFVIDKNGSVKFTHSGFDMSLEVMLAQELEVKNYTPAFGSKE